MSKKEKLKKQPAQDAKSKRSIKAQDNRSVNLDYAQEEKEKVEDKDISLEKSFWTVDGKVLRNLKQTIKYLEKIKKSAYAYHINKKKNDFANWIRDVYQKKQIAEKIKKVKTPKQIANIIRKMVK